jgi:hypothetical protein
VVGYSVSLITTDDEIRPEFWSIEEASNELSISQQQVSAQPAAQQEGLNPHFTADGRVWGRLVAQP